MNLFKKYSIKSKIQIISYSAIILIITMIVTLVLISFNVKKNTEQFESNTQLASELSQELSQKIRTNPDKYLTQKEILKYFDVFNETTKNKLTIPNFLPMFIMLLTLLLVLFMVFAYLLDQTILKSLSSLKKGMEVFFNYVINNHKEINKIDIIYDDEIGAILKLVNKNLLEVKKIVEYEREFNIQLEKDIIEKGLQLEEKSHYLKQFQFMIDEVESVIQFDIFGNIINVNQHYCNLTKYSKEELIGQPIAKFINSNENQNGFFEEITNIIKDGSIYKGINSDLSKDGKVYTTKTVILPMIPKQDDIIESFFCIRTNITPIIELTNEVIETQKDVITTMGYIGESRSKETGKHVKRVAEYTKLLALKYGLSKEESDLLCFASPMHDIGKIGIPDAILHKPGKLTSEEFEVMKTHPKIGYDMLKNSKREILHIAAIISHEHHEKYDGTGYPNQKKGEDIHIYGRITAVVDVFDALSTKRCYKKSWTLEEIIDHFKNEKGKQLDPKLVDLFLDNLDEFLAIREEFKDKNL